MKQSLRGVWFGGAALLAPVLLAGCGGSSARTAVEIIETIRQGRDNGQVASLAPDPQAVEEILALTPTALPEVKSEKGGISVAVFEPQTAAADKAFGNGCGRWLQLQVAGRPEFDGRPTWREWDYALREHELKDAGPTPEQAFAIGKTLALSHVVTGKLEGEGDEKTLVYQLWKLPERKPVGAPLRARGDRREIVTALPGMALSLASRLGVAGRRLPVAMELSAGELTELGKLPRLPQEPLPEAQAALVQKWAPTSSLAGMLAIAHLAQTHKYDGSDRSLKARNAAAQRLAKQAGQNCLMLAQVSAYDAAQLVFAPHWQALAAKYPRNYALAFTRVNWHKEHKDRKQQRQAVLTLLDAAPQSAWGWLQWDEMLGDEAQDVRQSRFITKMSREELDYVEQRYPQMVQASLKAVQCDSFNASAWLSLSRAAAFSGDSDLADNAYRQAMSLPSRGVDEHRWGLQLYQPKWQAHPGKMRQVAQLIYENPSLFVREYVGLVQTLQHAGMKADALQYEALAEQALAQWLERFPRDRIARSNYINLLAYRNDREGSARQARLLLKQYPGDEEGYIGLGKYYDNQDNWAEAVKYYEMALQREPNNGLALFRGGQAWHQMGQYDKAEVRYRRAIAHHPDYADPYNRLADLHFFVKNDRKEAERLYRKAIELDPSVELFQQNLEQCLAAGR